MTFVKTIAVAALALGVGCIGKRADRNAASGKASASASVGRAPAVDPVVEPQATPAKAPTAPTPEEKRESPLTANRRLPTLVPESPGLVAADPANPRAQFQSTRPEASSLKTGDLVFVRSRTRHALALGTAMPGEVNHVGIVFVTGDGPQVLAAEATLDQVSYDSWVRITGASRIVIKRLADESLLTPEKLLPLQRFSVSARGTAYDFGFAWGDSELYSSEFVYKAFAKGPGVELGKKQTLASLGLDAARAKLISNRYGAEITSDTEVVTPVSMLGDPRLTTVFDNKGPGAK